eukprot:jgi/Chlat1/7456/Chrsp6S07469
MAGRMACMASVMPACCASTSFPSSPVWSVRGGAGCRRRSASFVVRHVSAGRRRRVLLGCRAAQDNNGGNGIVGPSGSSENGSAENGTDAAGSINGSVPSLDSVALADNFCIIESRETVQDFAKMELEDLRLNVAARRNKIFLLMEEVRRLRIQIKLKSKGLAELLDKPQIPSVVPYLPPLRENTLKDYYLVYLAFVTCVIAFGGYLAPMLEVKLGLGGQSYAEFISSIHMPAQLSQVDPIVASFCGGAVGVISTLLVVEVNNVKTNESKRCHYCEGTGYLTCAPCAGAGTVPADVEDVEALVGSNTAVRTRPGLKLIASKRCSNCSGVGKASCLVMCPTCLCTGLQMATEHDQRIDPFQ